MTYVPLCECGIVLSLHNIYRWGTNAPLRAYCDGPARRQESPITDQELLEAIAEGMPQ